MERREDVLAYKWWESVKGGRALQGKERVMWEVSVGTGELFDWGIR